jgi:uncharacterized protein with HEPN domain
MSERSDNDPVLIGLRLRTVLAALERIPRRFATISEPSDFMSSEAGLDRLDSICMVLIAAGEEFKQIDRKTEGELFPKYPQISWQHLPIALSKIEF